MDKIIGFYLVNLLVPDEPDSLKINGQFGEWSLKKVHNYDKNKGKLEDRVSACSTYIIEHPFIINDGILRELMQICLSSSYLSGNTVTPSRSTPYSEIRIIEVGEGFPRERGISGIDSIINNATEFKNNMNLMVSKFDKNTNDYNIDIIIHYFLDLLSCWSLENMFLSIFTILEMIKLAERNRTNNPNLCFYDAIESVSKYLGITELNKDFIKMRNNLIHEGHLPKNKDKKDCIIVCAKVLMWFDEFIHKIFNLGKVINERFNYNILSGLNSYSIW